MSRWQIQTNPDLCTGCSRCLLVCARQYDQRFSLAAARIRIVATETDMVVDFLDDCRQCGLCADNCFYGALVKQATEEGAS